MAALVPLHGAAAGVATALGPLHVHRTADASTQRVLEDVRRTSAPPRLRPVHVATAFGHFHADGLAARHHHAAGDASVVRDPSDPLASAGDGDDGGATAATATFVALLPSMPDWALREIDTSPAMHAAWPSLTHDPEPFERPPRHALSA